MDLANPHDCGDTEAGLIETSDADRLCMHPAVSVLMLAYNHAEYLAAAIESVLGQNVGLGLELLIGEDASTDGTRDIALQYQKSHPDVIRLITSRANVGPYRNYCRLLGKARGRYIAHLDGDDYWLPEKLERQLQVLEDSPDCVAVYSNAMTVDNAGTPIGMFNDAGSRKIDLAMLLRQGNFLNNSSVLFRALASDSLLSIDRPYIDYRLHLRLARHGFLIQIGDPLAAYRVGSATSLIAHENKAVRLAYWEAITDVPRHLVGDDDYVRGIANFYRRVLFRSIRTGNPSLAREWWPVIMAESPRGKPHTLACVAAEFGRTLWAEGWADLRSRVAGRRMPILYKCQ